MRGTQPDRLVAILHSPPSRSSGMRTLSRVAQASRVLGCVDLEIVNLCDVPLDDVLAARYLSPSVWAASRRGIGRALKLRATSDVLLAYGVSVPSGPHRAPYLAQLDWLNDALASESIRVWSFGGRPTHPSRWQRVTTSEHPGVPLSDDLVRRFLRPPHTPESDITSCSAPPSAP